MIDFTLSNMKRKPLNIMVIGSTTIKKEKIYDNKLAVRIILKTAQPAYMCNLDISDPYLIGYIDRMFCDHLLKKIKKTKQLKFCYQNKIIKKKYDDFKTEFIHLLLDVLLCYDVVDVIISYGVL